MALEALLWDVDGTLAETERDGHRRAFNRAFAAAGVPLYWDAEAYGAWLGISGGAERIAAALLALEGARPQPERVEALQAAKQAHYAELMASGVIALRPGVADLISEANTAGLAQVIVTTSGRAAVAALVAQVLGGLAGAFQFWVCGDDVQHKKPDPEAYRQAIARLGCNPARVVCLEDSVPGLDAAAGAGLACLVTLSHYGGREPAQRFAAARAVLSELGPACLVRRGPTCQPGRITLSYLEQLL